MAFDINSNTHSSNEDVLTILGNFQNRQKYVRCSVYIEAKLILEDQIIECMIVDISQGGLRVQVPQQILVDTNAILRVDNFDEMKFEDLHCRVIRQKDMNLGLAFTEPTSKIKKAIQNLLGRSDIGRENRQLPRRAVMFKTNYYSGFRKYKARIIDISLSGICVKADKHFVSENKVKIETNRFGTYSCMLAWQKDTLFGLKFLEHPLKIIEDFGHILPQD